MKLKLFSLFVLMALAFGVKAQWSAVGNFTSTFDSAIQCVINDKEGNVYVAGSFTNSSGNKYVAKWNGTSWSELGGVNSLGAKGPILYMCIDIKGNVYIAGCDTISNRIGANYIAKWDKESNIWSELGSDSLNTPHVIISSICCDKSNNIFVAHIINDSSSYFSSYVSRWDGKNWTKLPFMPNISSEAIYNVCADDSGNVYASGGYPAPSNYHNYVVKWDKATNKCTVLGTTPFSLMNYTLYIDRMGNLYAGAYCSSFNNNTTYNVSKWNGTSWVQLGGNNALGVNNTIWSICADNIGNVYAAGDFTNSTNHNYIAKWTQSTNKWSVLGGTNPVDSNWGIASICIDNGGNLFAAGSLINKIGKIYLAKYGLPSPAQYIDKLDTTTCAVSVDVPVRGKNLYNISKLNGSIHWDTAYLNLGGIKFDSTYLKMNFNQIDVTHAANGYLTYNWSDSIGHTVADSAPLFTMVMYPKPNVSGGTGIWFDSIPSKLAIDTAIGITATNATYNNGWIILSDTPQIIQNVNILTCFAGCLPIHYQWYLNGVAIPFDTLNYIYPNSGGVYTCMVSYRTGHVVSSNSINVLLPVTLVSLNVQRTKGVNIINWQTATEINTSHFNIQRSTNGKDFETIGKVDANGASTYTFNDALSIDDSRFTKLYYRLEIVDKDGSKTYSEIRSVYLTTDDSGFTISPNPAKDYVTITGSNIKQVKLLDNMGRVVVVKEVNSTTINIPVNRLSKGLYMVQAIYTDGNMKTEKVVVE